MYCLFVICIVCLFYVLFVRSVSCFVSFCTQFVCKYVLYYCHRVATQLQFLQIYHIIQYNTSLSNGFSSCSWFTGCKHKQDKPNRHSVRQSRSHRCHITCTVLYVSVLNPKNHKLINPRALWQANSTRAHTHVMVTNANCNHN